MSRAQKIQEHEMDMFYTTTRSQNVVSPRSVPVVCFINSNFISALKKCKTESLLYAA